MTKDLRKYPYQGIIKSGMDTVNACSYLTQNNIDYALKIIPPILNDEKFPITISMCKFYFQKKEHLHLFQLLFDN